MQPIAITLLLLPAIVIPVALISIWWQRRVHPPGVKSRRLARISFWMILALGPLLIWLFVSGRRSDSWIGLLIAIQWTVAILRGFYELRASRSHPAAKI